MFYQTVLHYLNAKCLTQSANDNTTKIATTAYADAKVQNSLSLSTTVAPSTTSIKSYIDTQDLLKKDRSLESGVYQGKTIVFFGDSYTTGFQATIQD